MSMKKRIGEYQTIGWILGRYVFVVPQVRVILFPVVLSICVGKYFETRLAGSITRISDGLDNDSVPYRSIAIFLAISLMDIMFSELQGLFFAGTMQSVYRNTLRTTFEHFIRLETEDFEGYGTGTIQNIVGRKSRAVSDLVEVFVQNILPMSVSIILIWYSLYSNLGVIAFMIVAFAVVLYAMVTISIALSRNKVRRMLNKAENSASNLMHDTLSNHESVVSFDGYDVEVSRYDRKLIDIERHGTALFRGLYLLNMLQKLIFAFMNSSVIALGAYGVLWGKMDKGVLLFYVTMSRMLLGSLSNLGYTYCRLSEAMLSIKEVVFEDGESKGGVGLCLAKLKTGIMFKDVSCYYKDKRVLNGVNLQIMKGDRVAVIGSNGSGKSTILKALLKLNSMQGAILVDEIDTKAIEERAFRRMMGYVPQNSLLFNETVMYNIKYGCPSVSDYSVVELAKRFNVHDSIMRLEKGYFTNVGESGKHISGGERQKIAILRALLKNPEVLVMDEPTSSLDKEAEKSIIRTIMNSCSSMTVIAIVHNLELLSFFNKVCVVDNGNATILESSSNALSAIMSKLSTRDCAINTANEIVQGNF
ncbi:putative mitochondrial ABC transporter [Ordospora colligata]|uniref:Putative mitochondrial ABC transporter n=1 Tax=Ordospora colligata OC4 TaxID=1354746 RepID=A0A0B2UIT5_9MICR|nr:putative mitochondrial ABC transporter [Ordospora colligata OC4]KHN68885.1 putative mitochondrial ABC transporter [Ordospora colligata OC4]TBU13919.1 putative mitochondrial ABC transporter [Ordospora colligata]TBU14108.1 putative mitochondrial ABC transporter [Ordospora colligata]TBU17777.1 putative mitochondrial ABC transporter [Ordospora colligata]